VSDSGEPRELYDRTREATDALYARVTELVKLA
jgi:hypothetical protein